MANTMWERTARQIEADALDDLAGHRKLQSPAGQEFVSELRKLHNERTGPLMPWLAREFRKGRLRTRKSIDNALTYHPVLRGVPDNLRDALREYERYQVGARPDEPTVEGADLRALYNEGTAIKSVTAPTNANYHGIEYQDPIGKELDYSPWGPLTRENLNHWTDWYHQPDRRNVPLEQLKVHDLPGEVEKYERDKAKRLQDEAVEEGRHHGQVVHSWPDGWSVRKLPHGKALDFEAWNMRGDPSGPGDQGAPICVNWPQYQNAVEAGQTFIYSLRDPRGQPHVTMELEPTRWENRPFDIHEAIERNPVTRALPDEHKQQLAQYANRPDIAALDHEGLRQRWLHHDEGVPDEQDPDWPIGPLFELHRDHTRRPGVPIPENGEIKQIQGKGNSVPKPEYQARMKDWFHTFPEETRPNWDVPDDDIDHIGALVPDAETWDNYNGYAHVGDPAGPNMGGDHGGYGPHGDYGLAEPKRNIDYDSTVNSLLRARNSYEHRDTEHRHHEDNEIDALYREALRRGEIPQFAEAVQHYSDQAMESYDHLVDQNHDYLGLYPGESWDEDPEELRRQYEWDYNTPVEEAHETSEAQQAALQEYWKEKHDAYRWAEEELVAGHQPTQLANALFERVNPHYYGGPEDAWRNLPKHPTIIEHLRPNTEQLSGKQLPEGSYYANAVGNVSKTDPKRGYFRGVPTHIHLPTDPWPPQQAQQQVTAKVGDKPVRHLWAFSPTSGQVHVRTEADHHPADEPTHDSLASELGEVGLHHGYAYTIPGGWRILDYNHDPVADPFVLRHVVEHLRKQPRPIEF